MACAVCQPAANDAASLEIPEDDRPIPGCRGKHTSVGRNNHRPDTSSGRLECPDQASRGDFPHENPMLTAARAPCPQQSCSVACESDDGNSLGRRVERAQQAPAAEVPKLDRAIVTGGSPSF